MLRLPLLFYLPLIVAVSSTQDLGSYSVINSSCCKCTSTGFSVSLIFKCIYPRLLNKRRLLIPVIYMYTIYFYVTHRLTSYGTLIVTIICNTIYYDTKAVTPLP